MDTGRIVRSPAAVAWLVVAAATVTVALPGGVAAAAERPDWALVIHGGAGGIERARMPAEVAAMLRERLARALREGRRVLEDGDSAVAAVTACVAAMEDDPVFNAGRGAVLTARGEAELDASIMAGDGRRAGAVAGARRTRHPIRAAAAVMEHSRHVLFAGDGADAFAEERGLTMVDNAWFVTERQRRAFRRWRARQEAAGDDGDGDGDRDGAGEAGDGFAPAPWDGLGTVGCVALDRDGNLAAGTSTGGLPWKRPGRVGDSPLIGAGTYAWNEVCAVSASGHSESFIRTAAAHHVALAMARRDLGPAAAADAALAEVTAVGGSGGFIVLSADGEVAVRFTTAGMLRAWAVAGAEPVVRLFGDEE